ncbi:uncharacterized protein BYT42DRAFT_578597 [Radiomyces spectabilis]|uniref:uncharacterized protein n=1 Tax=Radiomyces spectabilis TaxID=64574 RepID=UPI002220360E|nr:uncharacterized protein BYT42DRAFT_578597 [Radiomyces spectabilis]KAI8372929.1 hypothetical protein BYT42DRAFT_578597 [Radiomyces spectabilis]
MSCRLHTSAICVAQIYWEKKSQYRCKEASLWFHGHTISASLFAADYGHVEVTYYWKDDGHNLGGMLTGSFNPSLLDRLYDEQVQYNFTGLK